MISRIVNSAHLGERAAPNSKYHSNVSVSLESGVRIETRSNDKACCFEYYTVTKVLHQNLLAAKLLFFFTWAVPATNDLVCYPVIDALRLSKNAGARHRLHSAESRGKHNRMCSRSPVECALAKKGEGVAVVASSDSLYSGGETA